MSENLDRVLAILAGAGDFLPATVIVAIILFFVKELLEVNRRRKANARKRLAIRRLVADEIERNNWTIKRLREGISELEQATEELKGTKPKSLEEKLKSHRIGVTLIKGHGGYRGAGCTLLYSVIPARSVSLLKRLVTEVDAQAFIAIMEADDVTGVEIGNQPHW